jgi:cellobiose-specific phosphotransferase system component IIC
MSRLTQLGVFCVVLGGVILFLGLFPFSVGLDVTAGIGATQIVAMLTGLFLLVLGAYVVVYAVIHRGQERTLAHMIGVRLGLTGLVFASAAAFADLMGFGSHVSGEGAVFGWLQAAGMMTGFLISALGVLIYGITRS